VNLTGIGSQAQLSVYYPGLAFPLQTFNGPTVTKTVTLTNVGSTPLSITNVQVIGSFSQINNCGNSVPAGAACTFNVTFRPTTAGAIPDWRYFYGNLAIYTSDPASPQMVLLGGDGTGVKLSAINLNFGSQAVGTTSSPKPVTLTNKGTNTLTFGSIVASGDFAETDNCLGGLAPRGTCTINVTFSPTQSGIRTGNLILNDNDGNAPQKVPLTGTGQ
jgi:hypothetical protein